MRRSRRGKVILTAVIGSAVAGGAALSMMAPRSCTPQQAQAGQCSSSGGMHGIYFGNFFGGSGSRSTSSVPAEPVTRGGFGSSFSFHGIGE